MPGSADEDYGATSARLPDWSTVHDDRGAYRTWKRLVRQAGKRRSLSLLEPHIRAHCARIRNRQHTGSSDSTCLRPTERRRQLLAALDEIAANGELTQTRQIADDSSRLTEGMWGVGLYVIMAGRLLIESMLATADFERKVLGCLTMLEELDRDLVPSFGRAISEKQSSEQ